MRVTALIAAGCSALLLTLVADRAAAAAAPPTLSTGTVTTYATGNVGAGDFYTVGDYVHVSTTPPPTASGHGCWARNSGPAQLAVVTVWLQAQSPTSGAWATVANARSTLKPGCGSAYRTTARFPCTNVVQIVKWRSVIDVDIVGYGDPPDQLTTQTQTLFCGSGVH